MKLLMELAACYQFDTRAHTYEQAVQVYEQFIQNFPDNPLCAKAYFNIGRCYDAFTLEREKDIQKARTAYRACYESYPDSQWADQAYFWHANSYIYKLTPRTAETAAKMLETFLQNYPRSLLTAVAHSQLSELYCAWLNDHRASIRHSEAALDHGIRDTNIRRLHLYRLGYLYQFKMNDAANAIRWYKKLMDESPMQSDPNYFAAKKRVEELTASENSRTGTAGL
ncbi:MAG: tetratricopeptide repeat protein [Candidatus Pacebacteria bacterium]|nr:tetratricopeptide repeat protein [Candidatus Paceibacterota bacterium]